MGHVTQTLLSVQVTTDETSCDESTMLTAVTKYATHDSMLSPVLLSAPHSRQLKRIFKQG